MAFISYDNAREDNKDKLITTFPNSGYFQAGLVFAATFIGLYCNVNVNHYRDSATDKAKLCHRVAEQYKILAQYLIAQFVLAERTLPSDYRSTPVAQRLEDEPNPFVAVANNILANEQAIRSLLQKKLPKVSKAVLSYLFAAIANIRKYAHGDSLTSTAENVKMERELQRQLKLLDTLTLRENGRLARESETLELKKRMKVYESEALALKERMDAYEISGVMEGMLSRLEVQGLRGSQEAHRVALDTLTAQLGGVARETDVAAVRSELVSAKAFVDAQGTALDSVKGEVSALAVRMGTQERALVEVQGKEAALTKDVASLKGAVGTQEAALGGVKGAVGALTTRMDAQEKALAEMQERERAFAKALDDLKAELQTKFSKLEQALTSVQAQATTDGEQIKHVKGLLEIAGKLQTQWNEISQWKVAMEKTLGTSTQKIEFLQENMRIVFELLTKQKERAQVPAQEVRELLGAIQTLAIARGSVQNELAQEAQVFIEREWAKRNPDAAKLKQYLGVSEMLSASPPAAGAGTKTPA